MATKKKEKEPEVAAPIQQEYMRTGCDLLDLLIGGDKGVYGLPFGTILNIIGDKSAGKTFVKNEILAANYWRFKDRFVFHSDDAESGDTFDSMRLYNVDLHPEEHKIGPKRIGDSATVEQMDAQVSLVLQSMEPGQVGIYALDSLDGLSDATREEMEANRLKLLKAGDTVEDPGDYGAQIAKFMSQQFFRTKHKKLRDAQLSVIIVSQIRENMKAGMYGQKWTVSCGKALEFYAHTRIFLKTIYQIKKGDRVIGVYVSASTTKSKTPRPYRTVYFTIFFDYGIDNIGSNLDFLFDLRGKDGELTKAAKEITWSETAREKNRDNFVAWLTEKKLLEECMAAAKKTKTSLSVADILEWVEADTKRQEAFDREFGKTYTRVELIDLLEKKENATMREELTRRVREKWERIEDSIKTGRPGKYSQE